MTSKVGSKTVQSAACGALCIVVSSEQVLIEQVAAAVGTLALLSLYRISTKTTETYNMVLI